MFNTNNYLIVGVLTVIIIVHVIRNRLSLICHGKLFYIFNSNSVELYLYKLL